MHAVSTSQIVDISRFNDNDKYFRSLSYFAIISNKMQNMRNSEKICHASLGTAWYQLLICEKLFIGVN